MKGSSARPENHSRTALGDCRSVSPAAGLLRDSRVCGAVAASGRVARSSAAAHRAARQSRAGILIGSRVPGKIPRGRQEGNPRCGPTVPGLDSRRAAVAPPLPMLSSLSVLALGFILGMRHATDVDHVVAVTTIVSQQRSVSRAARVGALWGAGHTATIVLVGGGILVFRLAVPPRLGLAMEFAVAVMLVLLGVRALRETRTGQSAAAWSPVRPLLVGFVHGMAGSAFVAMLVLTAIDNPLIGITYLLVFGVGTIAGDRGAVSVRRRTAEWRAALRAACGRRRERLLRSAARPPRRRHRWALCRHADLDGAVARARRRRSRSIALPARALVEGSGHGTAHMPATCPGVARATRTGCSSRS